MFKGFISNFKADSIPEIFEPCYFEACKEFEDKGVFFFEKEYILSVQEKTNAFPRILDDLLYEAERLKKDPETALYALFLYKALLIRKEFISNFSSFKLVPDYPLLGFLVILPAIKNTFETFERRNIPSDIISATMTMFQDCAQYQEDAEVHYLFSEGSFSWLQRYIDCRVLHIGRFRHEMKPLRDPIYVLKNTKDGSHIILHDGGEMNSEGLYSDTPPLTESVFTASFTETDTSYFGNVVSKDGRCLESVREFSKEVYKIVLKKGDMILSVHISPEGELTQEKCEDSYNRGLEIFKKYYPEHDFKAFHCGSWLLSTELNSVLKPTSNILKFKEKYSVYPIRTKGEDVFNFVFGKKCESYEDLPEKTSLQKAIKEIYLSGGYIYEYGGIDLL